MFWKTFRSLIFKDGSCRSGRLRRNLSKVQTFAGPCCTSFLIFRVVDFFPVSSETTSHLVTLLCSHSRFLLGIVSTLLRSKNACWAAGLYSIALHCAFLLRIISYVISVISLINEHGDLSFFLVILTHLLSYLCL